MSSKRVAVLAVAIVIGLAVACGGGGTRYDAHGVVESVGLEYGQVVIDHDDIPGFMPAMTMNFSVPDRALLAQLAPGQVIDFVLDFDGRSYKVVEVSIVGEVEPGDGWARFGEGLVRADAAPDFTLIDQSSRPVALADFAGKPLLLDFIFTSCPGPCPILTGVHVSAQRALPAALRDRVHFVSISLDPRNDSPEAMRAYAEARGADLSGWSFLTGPVEEVDAVVRAYGVGTTRSEEGEIEHMVVTFLIDGNSQIVKRYMGTEHEPEEVVADLEGLVSTS